MHRSIVIRAAFFAAVALSAQGCPNCPNGTPTPGKTPCPTCVFVRTGVPSPTLSGKLDKTLVGDDKFPLKSMKAIYYKGSTKLAEMPFDLGPDGGTIGELVSQKPSLSVEQAATVDRVDIDWYDKNNKECGQTEPCKPLPTACLDSCD